MAKKDEDKAKTSAKHNRVEGYVFGIRLEGSDEVVSEGIKAFSQAMAKSGVTLGSTSSTKPVLMAPKSTPATSPAEGTEPEEELLQEEPEEVEASAGAEEENETEKPKRSRTYKAPKFLADLKLSEAKVPLADYMKEKNPQDMMDKYAVVAVWLKESFDVKEISIDHIYTAFKHLGWESQLPTNIAKPLANLTYSRNWFQKGEAKNTFALVWLGESEVAKMGAVGATK